MQIALHDESGYRQTFACRRNHLWHGQNAGNAPIELIAMYMNSNLGKNYDISQFLEAIDAI